MGNENDRISNRNEEGNVIKEEIKEVINLLKDNSSDNVALLERLYRFLNASFGSKEYLGKTFLEMNFLEASAKLLEDENNVDENNLIIAIIKKIAYADFDIKERKNLKMIDAFDSLYKIMINYSKTEISEDSRRVLIIIIKKYPLDLLNNNKVKDIYKDLLSSKNEYSYEQKENVFILFKELIKEEIIKKKELGSEIIERIMFAVEEMKKKKDGMMMKEEFINEANDFIKIAKEKGFEEDYLKNKNVIIIDYIFYEWKELLKDDNSSRIWKGQSLKKDKEKIKNFCDIILTNTFDIQIEFIDKLSSVLDGRNSSQDYYYYFFSKKNGLFLYYFLPLFFKNYNFEEKLPLFFHNLFLQFCKKRDSYYNLTLLNNEIIEKIMKEEKGEMEINEEKVIILVYFWSLAVMQERKKKEIDCFIDLTVKVFEWLGKIEDKKKEEKKEETKEETKEEIKEEYKNLIKTDKEINKKEMMLYKLLSVIVDTCFYFGFGNLNINKDERVGVILLEIIKNHLENERNLIKKENKKKIIEYVIYSYYEDNRYPSSMYIDTSNLLSFSSSSFPFSHNTIVYMLHSVGFFLLDNKNKEIKQKVLLKYTGTFIDIYMNIINIINGCDIKREIGREIFLEWNNNIINIIKEKISFNWTYIFDILTYLFDSTHLSSFDYDNNNAIKELVKLFFSHSNNEIFSNEKEKEREENVKGTEEIMLIKPFLMNENDRKVFIEDFLYAFNNEPYYNILDIYYFINKSEEGCNIINIFLKELSGEIADRIKKREGNNNDNNNNIIKERRRYERERIDNVFLFIFYYLRNIVSFTLSNRKKVYLGWKRNDNSYKGKEKVKEKKNNISDKIEEEDMRECLILYLKNVVGYYEKEIFLSDFSKCSELILSFFT